MKATWNENTLCRSTDLETTADGKGRLMVILWVPSILLSIGLSVGLTLLLNAVLKK